MSGLFTLETVRHTSRKFCHLEEKSSSQIVASVKKGRIVHSHWICSLSSACLGTWHDWGLVLSLKSKRSVGFENSIIVHREEGLHLLFCHFVRLCWLNHFLQDKMIKSHWWQPPVKTTLWKLLCSIIIIVGLQLTFLFCIFAFIMIN